MMDRRAFMRLLGLGGAAAAAVPAHQLWKAGDEPRVLDNYNPVGMDDAARITLTGSQSITGSVNGVTLQSPVLFSTGGEFSAASDDLTIAKSKVEAYGLLPDGDQGIWWEPELCPAEFIRVYRDGAGGVHTWMQTDVPVGFYDDGTGKLRAARANAFVTYFVDRHVGHGNEGLALTVGQAQHDSLALAEAAIFTERTVFHPLIQQASTYRTAIIAQATVMDLNDAKFIQDVRGPGRMS